MSEFPRQKIYIVGDAEKNERCPIVFVCNLWIHRILLSEEERKFILGEQTESS